jgi:hypothetical protein
MVNRKVDDKNVIVAQPGESLTNEVLERYDESNDGLQNKFHSRFVGLKKNSIELIFTLFSLCCIE